MAMRTGRKLTPQQAAHRRGRHREVVNEFKYARERPTVLRAAGIKIERMSSDRLRAIAGQKQPWQALAWGYRDMIGELRSAMEFRSQAISRVKFYAAEIINDDDEPVALSLRDEVGEDGQPTERAEKVTLDEQLCAAAEEELGRLPLDSGDAFLGVWSENFDVAGECWLYGREDRDTGEEVWEIRSVDDVDVQGSTVAIKDELGQPRAVDLSPESGEELYRLWRKHPRRPYLADSSLNACLDSLEDIVLVARELRAAARSRIAANGIAFIPEGMTEMKNQRKDDDREPRDAFIADLTAAIVAPISNEGDAGGIAPLVVVGTREDIGAVRIERLEREDSPTLIQKLDKGLARMAQSIAVPPEIVTGLAGVNHWTAWQIDVSTFRYYLEPSIRLMADSLTQCFLRAALIGRGFPADQVKRIRVWFDAGAITENPNRRQDTLDALGNQLISPRTGRKELGFNEGDAPTPEETLQMIAAKSGMDAAAATQILAWLATQQGAEMPALAPTPAPVRRGLPSGSQPVAPDGTGVGGTGTPTATGLPASGEPTRPAVVVAAAERLDGPPPLWTLDSVLGLRLAEIERGLRDQILLAADSALTRALERAGSRLRSKAQRDPALVASLRGKPVGQWAGLVGRDQTFALGADVRFLLRDAFTQLGEKFAEWTSRAIDAMVGRILAFLKIKPDTPRGRATAERMRGAMGGRIGAAWSRLHAQLEAHAERLLFNEQGEPIADGEDTDLNIPPDLVRQALAIIGGLPETAGGVDAGGRIPTGEAFTGMADGEAVTGELAAQGIVAFGREWKYNPELERNTFLPHFDLDGERFTSWTDDVLKVPLEYAWIGTHFRPKDHQGCLCTTSVTYAVPTPNAKPVQADDSQPMQERDWDQALADQLRERLRQPSQDMAYTIELAESDDRAGRRFTVAQQTRDQWLEVQRLHAQFLNGE
jgi:hypothetical protein